MMEISVVSSEVRYNNFIHVHVHVRIHVHMRLLCSIVTGNWLCHLCGSYDGDICG